MKIAVIGGAGFIGSALVRRLADEHEVTVFDNFSRGMPTNLPANVSLIKADAKEGGLNLRGYEWVYDFAARVAGARDLYNDPAPLLTDNVRITTASLQAIVDCEVPNYFFVSSSCVYDFPGAKVPHNEDDTQICDTSYGFSKVVGEQMTKWYAKQYGFSARIVRLFNVYGPNDSPLFPHVIPDFFRKAEACKAGAPTFAIMGDGLQTRDFTYMDDVVSGLLTVTLLGEHLQPYNIGTGVQTSVRRLAEMVCETAGLGTPPTFTNELAAKEDIQRRAADATRLRALGWEPKTTLAEGLRKMKEAMDGKTQRVSA